MSAVLGSVLVVYHGHSMLSATAEELTRLEHACAGRSFAQRRDTAIIAVFKATGIRRSELAGLRYDPGDPRRSDIDLWQREITVRGKGGKDRIVRIGHQVFRDALVGHVRVTLGGHDG